MPELEAMDTEHQLALAAAWDRADMSRRFIGLARSGGSQQIKLIWCLYAAAGGLWSAVNIVQEKVDHLGRGVTNDWFKHRNLELVSSLRHGGTHHSDSGTRGIGFRFTSRGVEFFLNAPSPNDQLPIADVIAFLDTAQAAVDEFLYEASGGLRAVSVMP